MRTLPTRDARSLPHDTLEEFRRVAVRRVLAGESQRAVAASLEVHPNTVCKWMRKYRLGGANAIRSTKATGRPRKLTPRQEAKLRRVIIGKNPRQLNFGVALWTIPVVGDLIRELFDTVLAPSSISRLLRRLGLSPQKPARRAFQRDEAEVREWAERDFPEIVRQVRSRQSIILFLDEAGVHEDAPVGTTEPPGARRAARPSSR